MTTLEEISALTQPRHPDDWTEIDSAAVDTVRVLAADAVQKVGNGHPGTAMSLAPLAYTLFQRTMRHDPSDTHWLGRDRFVLSAGHSSLTLYLQLYLGGFGLELSDIESLRTWGSKTPGHPEFRHTKGVEITTGPLGQGLASAVGMAMASRYERGLFDPDAAPGESPFDHHIYVIASDGDIEEGVTSEASSLAAVQQLGNLIVFYDHNQISIEDDTNIALCEDTAARYRAYGWHVQEVEGGENVVGIEEAIANAQGRHRPAVVHLAAHHHRLSGAQPDEHRQGARRGSRRRGGRRRQEDPRIRSRQDVRGPRGRHRPHPRAGGSAARKPTRRWQPEFEAWAQREPERKALLDRLTAEKLPDGWDADIPYWEPGSKALATRAASGEVLSAVGPKLPELWGGSADLAGSNNTTMKGVDSFGPPSISTKDYTAALVRPHPAFRYSRARDGRHPVRHRAARPHPRLRRHVPAVLRLHARRGAAGVADGHRHHLRLDARLDRARRGRPDPSADRAPVGAARHPQPVGGAPGRRQRDRLRLAHHPGPRQRQRSGRA